MTERLTNTDSTNQNVITGYIIIATALDNQTRRTCHELLDRIAAKKRNIEKDKFGRRYRYIHNKVNHLDFDDPIMRGYTCPHKPKCFRNYNCIDYVRYYQTRQEMRQKR